MTVDALHKIIGSNIRGYRKKLEYSQEKLAYAAKLTPEHISRIEGGSVNIKIDSLHKICEVLHIPISLLFTEESYKKTKKR